MFRSGYLPKKPRTLRCFVVTMFFGVLILYWTSSLFSSLSTSNAELDEEILLRDHQMQRTRPPNNELFSPTVSTDSLDIEAAKKSRALEMKGRGRRIIATALYGNLDQYVYGALENALLVKRDWPEWKLRIYHDDSVLPDVLETLRLLGVELVNIKDDGMTRWCPRFLCKGQGSSRKSFSDHGGLFWRFFVILDRSVTRFIVRDLDSRLSKRDRATVQEWEESGEYFHSIHDHPAHAVPILGGMWGAVGGFLGPDFVKSFQDRDSATLFNDDQRFLQETMWPIVAQYTLTHDSFLCDSYLEAKVKMPIPIQRTSSEDFIGNCYTMENNYTGLSIERDCPRACRKFPEWKHC